MSFKSLHTGSIYVIQRNMYLVIIESHVAGCWKETGFSMVLGRYQYFNFEASWILTRVLEKGRLLCA